MTVILSLYVLELGKCPAPAALTGGSYNCAVEGTAFGGTCELTCDDGYFGDAQLICNVDNGGTLLDWEAVPTCTRKSILINLCIIVG